MTDTARFLPRPGGGQLAYTRRRGREPGVMFLGGFHSSMGGIKASALDVWTRRTGRSFVRFDYFAHGQSSGDWLDATISHWREDALTVLDTLTTGPQVLVGSSMGGWMALLAALARPDRVRALVLVAPAPDMTEALMWQAFPPAVRNTISEAGQWARPANEGDPVILTRKLIEDGRQWSLLGGSIPFDGPVRILHGLRDIDVPWSHSSQLIDCLTSQDVEVQLTKSGDHSLSSPTDLARLISTIDAVLED